MHLLLLALRYLHVHNLRLFELEDLVNYNDQVAFISNSKKDSAKKLE